MLGATEQFLVPWIITNSISFLLIYLCYKWPLAGRIVFGVIFLLAAAVNTWMALFRPAVYLEYGELAFLDFYKAFIYGFFAEHTQLLVLLIAFGQGGIAAGLFFNEKLLLPAVAGAALFLLAIVPLGVGSAFPATLLMVLALGLLVFRRNKSTYPYS
jgi:hypothetical protein